MCRIGESHGQADGQPGRKHHHVFFRIREYPPVGQEPLAGRRLGSRQAKGVASSSVDVFAVRETRSPPNKGGLSSHWPERPARGQETPDCDSQVNRLWFRGSTVRTPKPAYHLFTCCSLEGCFLSRQRNTKPGFKRQNSCTSDPLSQTRKAFSGTSVRQDRHCSLPEPPIRSVTGLHDPGGGDHPPCSLNRLVSPGESHRCEFHRRVGSPVTGILAEISPVTRSLQQSGFDRSPAERRRSPSCRTAGASEAVSLSLPPWDRVKT
jgi:hypothetical protein